MEQTVNGFINKLGNIIRFKLPDHTHNFSDIIGFVLPNHTHCKADITDLDSNSNFITEFPANPSIGDTYQYWGDNPNYEKGQVYVFQLDNSHQEIFYWKPKFALHGSEILPENTEDPEIEFDSTNGTLITNFDVTNNTLETTGEVINNILTF